MYDFYVIRPLSVCIHRLSVRIDECGLASGFWVGLNGRVCLVDKQVCGIERCGRSCIHSGSGQGQGVSGAHRVRGCRGWGGTELRLLLPGLCPLEGATPFLRLPVTDMGLSCSPTPEFRKAVCKGESVFFSLN